MGEGGDVDAPGRHVGGHEEAHLARAHFGHDLLSATLRQVGGKLVGVVAEALQHAADVVDVGLGVAEDDGRSRILHLDDAHERPVLVHGLHAAEVVLHFRHVHFLLGEGEHGGLGHELGREVEHVGRVGRGEEARVDAVAGEILLYLLHVGVEADGEHAVGFIEDQHPDARKIQGAAQNVVKHASRGADDELGTVLEGVKLLFVADAAVESDGRAAGAFKQGLRLLLHLQGELARGHQHEGLGVPGIGFEHGQHGEQIAACLAGARPGLDHDVPAVHEVGQGQGLHGHEAGPAGASAGFLHDWGQPFELHGREGVVRLLDVQGAGVFGSLQARRVNRVFGHGVSRLGCQVKKQQGKARKRPCMHEKFRAHPATDGGLSQG